VEEMKMNNEMNNSADNSNIMSRLRKKLQVADSMDPDKDKDEDSESSYDLSLISALSLYKDGESELIEVDAPAGPLEMFLDSGKDNVPTVHTILPTSVLAHLVQPGDIVFSVNGKDTIEKSCMDVSLLLQENADESRKIVFIRVKAKEEGIFS